MKRVAVLCIGEFLALLGVLMAEVSIISPSLWDDGFTALLTVITAVLASLLFIVSVRAIRFGMRYEKLSQTLAFFFLTVSADTLLLFLFDITSRIYHKRTYNLQHPIFFWDSDWCYPAVIIGTMLISLLLRRRTKQRRDSPEY